jgi:oligopeptide/dipeptide ABC transporter ATP-binding protein
METQEKKVLLETRGLQKYFYNKSGLRVKSTVKAVDGVDLVIHESETVGLVGESGCGKSTLGRAILRLQEPTGGQVFYRGREIQNLPFQEMRPYRKEMQIVFQDPAASLNPRTTILESVKLPLKVNHIGTAEEQQKKAEEMLQYVELNPGNWYKFPHEMSGGQKQRAMIARALILHPSFIVCDEPVSALDVSIQAQVLNLMKRIQQEEKLSYLFISHDLSVVRYLCDTIAVMYLGQIIEQGSRSEIFDHPLHPYTRALMSAIPVPDIHVKMNRIVLTGDVPSPMNPPSGCRFRTRCPYATPACAEAAPALTDIGGGHRVACSRLDEI